MKGEWNLRRIIIASHGEYAKGLKNSIELIVGNLADNIETFCLYPSESPMDFKDKIEAEIKKETNTEFVFLCDLKGGSVHTACTQLCGYKNVKVFGGTNMNLLLDLLLSCPEAIGDLEEATLLDNARKGITLMTRKNLVSGKDDDF